MWLEVTLLFSLTFQPLTDKFLCFHEHSRFVRLFSTAPLCFHRHSRFVPSILSQPWSAVGAALVAGQPARGAHKGRPYKIFESTLCFHRHSRFVPSILSQP